MKLTNYLHLFVPAESEHIFMIFNHDTFFSNQPTLMYCSAIPTSFIQIWRGPSCCASSNIYYISTVNTQHIQGSNVLLQLGCTWPGI